MADKKTNYAPSVDINRLQNIKMGLPNRNVDKSDPRNRLQCPLAIDFLHSCREWMPMVLLQENLVVR